MSNAETEGNRSLAERTNPFSKVNGRPIQPLNEAEVIDQCKIIREKGLKVVVLVAVFSPLDNDGQFEKAAAAIIQREIPGVLTVCSSDIG